VYDSALMQDAAFGDCQIFNDYNGIGGSPTKTSRIDSCTFIKSSYVTFRIMVSSYVNGWTFILWLHGYRH